MIFGLLRAGRMLGRAASSGPKRPPADPKDTAIAWLVLAAIVLPFLWQPVLIVDGIALLLCLFHAWDRKTTARSAPDPLDAVMHELLATEPLDPATAALLKKYDDNGRRK